MQLAKGGITHRHIEADVHRVCEQPAAPRAVVVRGFCFHNFLLAGDAGGRRGGGAIDILDIDKRLRPPPGAGQVVVGFIGEVRVVGVVAVAIVAVAAVVVGR